MKEIIELIMKAVGDPLMEALSTFVITDKAIKKYGGPGSLADIPPYYVPRIPPMLKHKEIWVCLFEMHVDEIGRRLTHWDDVSTPTDAELLQMAFQLMFEMGVHKPQIRRFLFSMSMEKNVPEMIVRIGGLIGTRCLNCKSIEECGFEKITFDESRKFLYDLVDEYLKHTEEKRKGHYDMYMKIKKEADDTFGQDH